MKKCIIPTDMANSEIAWVHFQSTVTYGTEYFDRQHIDYLEPSNHRDKKKTIDKQN